MKSSPATNLRRQIAGVSLILAPVLMLVADALWFGAGMTMTGLVMWKVVFLIYLLAILGMVHLLRRNADRLGLAAGLLAFTGLMTGPSLVTLRQVNQATLDAGLSANIVEQVSNAIANNFPIMATSAYFTGPAFPLGLILFGVGLYRVRVMPKWAAALLILSGILYPIGRIGGILPVIFVCDVVAVIAMGLIGWRILSWTAEEWEQVPVFSKEPIDADKN